MDNKELPRDYDGRLSIYSFPGCYQIAYFTRNGDMLCGDCAREIEAHPFDWDLDDMPWDCFINWEGDSIYCDECGKELESEYGPIEEE